MENKNNLLLVVLLVIVVILLSWGLTKNYEEYNVPVATGAHICESDSLKKVIDSLQSNITTLENGFDFRERRYEDILFEYELGLGHIEKLYPEAFKEFHRVIAHKEYFTHKSMHENNKRLNIKDEYNR
jgi:hypothetical protein